MNENNNNNCIESNKTDLANSKALFVLKIITMSFAILACVVGITVLLTKWIMDLNAKLKESHSRIARAAARIERFRKERIKHILKQRRAQLKEEKEDRKKKNYARDKKLTEMDIDDDETEEIDDSTDDEDAINDFDNELSDAMLDDIDEI